jgi:3-hydroxy-3-methylglutaryl CoA synthase
MNIGIDKLGFYPCTLSLDIRLLCEQRGFDADNFVRRFHCDERSVVGPYEDVVTLAVNAAEAMLTAEERDRTGLLIVATESGVDHEKPVSSWVHRFLGLPSACRNFEVKHACYGATAAVQMATAWLASQPDPAARALVIATDYSLLGMGVAQEPVLGAGAMAVSLSRKPRILAYDQGWNGVFAHEVADLFRPAPGVEMGDADESLTSYLDGVDATYDAYVARVGRAVEFDSFFAANIYHVPFGGLAERAHLRLARRCLGADRAAALAHFARKTLPSLTYNRRAGGVYGGSTFLALLGLLDHGPWLQEGDRIGIYAYGSGSCAEFYSGTLGRAAREMSRASGAMAALDARRKLTIAEYEACERSLDRMIRARDFRPQSDGVPDLWRDQYAGRRRLTLHSIENYRRSYGWADA